MLPHVQACWIFTPTTTNTILKPLLISRFILELPAKSPPSPLICSLARSLSLRFWPTSQNPKWPAVAKEKPLKPRHTGAKSNHLTDHKTVMPGEKSFPFSHSVCALQFLLGRTHILKIIRLIIKWSTKSSQPTDAAYIYYAAYLSKLNILIRLHPTLQNPICRPFHKLMQGLGSLANECIQVNISTKILFPQRSWIVHSRHAYCPKQHKLLDSRKVKLNSQFTYGLNLKKWWYCHVFGKVQYYTRENTRIRVTYVGRPVLEKSEYWNSL